MALLALGTGLFVATGGPSSAQVTAVSGSAYGYLLDVSLFTAQQPVIGPTPAVALPAEGSATPVTDTAATGSASAGPARFFSSGPITVSAEGTPADATVTSSTEIDTINTSQDESLTATALASRCEAVETGLTGSTTFAGGVLATDSGDDAVNDIPDHPPVFVDLPNDPAPNTEYLGHIHVNGQTDEFRYVFNEQVVTADSITVNAAHQYILGPTAVGDLFIGQAVCSLAAAPATTTTTAPPATTSTVPPATTTTTPPGGTTDDGSGGRSPLARTGGSLRLVIPALSALALGAILLRGERPGWAGGPANGGLLTTAARRLHRRRYPWDRRGRR